MIFDSTASEIIRQIFMDSVSRAGSYIGRKIGAWQASAEYRGEVSRIANSYAAYFTKKYNSISAPAHMSRPMYLTQLYIDPSLRSVKQSLRSLTVNEVQEELFHGETKYSEFRKDGLQFAEKESHLVVLGRAGAGKTAFLKTIGLAYLRGDTQRRRIPFLIDANDFSLSHLGIVDYLVKLLGLSDLWRNADQFVRAEILGKSSGILLWDGLDEVRSRELLKKVVSAISDLAAAYPDCPQIVACRSAAYQDSFPLFTKVEIAPFGSEQIERFVSNWFADNTVKQRVVLQRIEEAGPGRQLSDSPLLLTLQCLAADEDLHDFQSRAHLFRTATNALLSKWDAVRNVVRAQLYKEMTVTNKVVLLSQIAAAGVETGVYTWTERELAIVVEGVVSRFGMLSYGIDGVSILKSMEQQHGILEERAKEIWSFSHMALQEYFAAVALSDTYDRGQLVSLIENKLDDPAWREVIILIMCLKIDASPLVEAFGRSVREGIGRRNIPAQIKWIERDGQNLGNMTPYITRSLCLWLVMHQLLQLAEFVDQRISAVTHSNRVDLTSAVRSVVRRLCNEEDIQGRLIGKRASPKGFPLELAASRDRVYELLQEAVEDAAHLKLDRHIFLGRDIVEYFNLSDRSAPTTGSLLSQWDRFRVFGVDVTWLLRRLLLGCEIYYSGAIMTPQLRQECLNGLVQECVNNLTCSGA